MVIIYISLTAILHQNGYMFFVSFKLISYQDMPKDCSTCILVFCVNETYWFYCKFTNLILLTMFLPNGKQLWDLGTIIILFWLGLIQCVIKEVHLNWK